MTRTQLALVLLLLAAAGLVAVLALRNPQAPFVPADEQHAGFRGTAGCLTCHGAEGVAPRSPNHPLGSDCLRCHGLR